jgi:acetyl-CoA carboxylase biotin carboxyl carrier protein
MDLNEIKALIEAMQASDLAEMEVSENGWTLRMVRGADRPVPVDRPAPPPAAPPGEAPKAAAHEQPAADSGEIRAPLAGIVHLVPSPGEAPFVAPGQAVAVGATLCLIEAMKVFNAVRTERGGTVEAVLVSEEAEVEAGQALMRIV